MYRDLRRNCRNIYTQRQDHGNVAQALYTHAHTHTRTHQSSEGRSRNEIRDALESVEAPG